MEFTKLDEINYLAPKEWGKGIAYAMSNGASFTYTFDIPKIELRNIKINIINDNHNLVTDWYSDIKTVHTNLFIYVDYESIVLLKRLRRDSSSILFESFANCKVDYRKDLIYSIDYVYNSSNIDTVYQAEVHNVSTKYPKLFNLLNFNKDNPFQDNYFL
jgi:hypothetical protein